MKSILVTGANGQLGKTIQELFEYNDFGLNFIFLDKEELDITVRDSLENYFKNHNFDYCINCAAYTNVEQAEKNPEIAYKINADAVKNLAEQCCITNTTLIHISTDYVFDGEKKSPYSVNDKTNPINEYGKSKLKGEEYIKTILSDFYIIRTSWLYSKKYGNNFYKTILKKAKAGEELYITATQKGCPTNTVNLSRYIIELILDNHKVFGVLHFCDSKVMTWYDFAKNILEENYVSNKVKLYKSNTFITLAERPKYSVLKME